MADEQIIVDIKVDSEDVKAADKRIDELTDSIEELGNRIKTARDQNKLYKKEQQELNKAYNSNKISSEKYLKEVDRLNTKIKTNNKIIATSRVELSKQRRERNANIKLVNSEVGAYTNLSNKYTIAAKKAKDLAVQYGINSKESKKAAAAANQLNNQLKKIDSSVGLNTRRVGDYRGALKGFGRQLLGAAGIVGAVDLLIKGFTALREKSLALGKATRQIANTFEVTNSQAKGLSATVLALANNFEKDYNEIIRAANAVSKEFDISATQALAHIEEGLKKGSDNSDEFLDILREYPAQLQSVGLNAQESFAIINQQVRAGVYSDKGIDAIKEAGLSLRENTVAVKEALKPLSDNVKLEIEREVAAGNTFKAMQLISGELKNLTVQQKQLILADIFKGAGEDALTFVENLHELNLNLDNVEKQTTKVEDANLKLSKTWNKVVAGFSDSEGIFSRIWASILEGANETLGGLEDLSTWINEGWDAAVRGFNSRNTGVGKSLDKVNEKTKSTRKSYEELNKEVDENNELTKEQIRLREKLAKQYQDDLKWADEYIEKIEEERRAKIKLWAAEAEARKQREKDFQIADDEVSEMEMLDAELEAIINNNDLKLEAEQEFLEERAKLNEDALNKQLKKEQLLRKGALIVTDSFSSHYSNIAQQREDAKIEKIQENANRQQDILKNQLDKGLITEANYNLQVEELQKQAAIKEAQLNKRKNIIQIGIDTLTAVIKTFANLGWPAGIVPAAFVAGKGALNAALVKASSVTFGEGTSDIVNIGNSHASGNDVDVWGYSGSKKQYFGKVERGEAMPVIRKSAVSDYMIAKMNGQFSPSNSKTFQSGTPDITQNQDSGISIPDLMNAFSNIKVVAKIEDITKEAGKKMEIVDNSKV